MKAGGARWHSLVELVESRACELAAKRAFSFLPNGGGSEQSLTYEQLIQRAGVVARVLSRRAELGDRVLLLLPPGLDFVVGFFGTLLAGMVAVPIPAVGWHKGRARALAAIAGSARPAAVLCDARTEAACRLLQHELPALDGLKVLQISELAENGGMGRWQAPRLDPASLALVQYTSGSTGAPKGVMLSHGNLLQNSAMIERCFGNDRDSRAVIWLPPFHDMGLIGGVIQPVYCGGSATLMSPASIVQRPALWLETISRTRATVSGGPAFAYDLCVRRVSEAQRQTLDLRSWKVAFCGAEPIRAEIFERFSRSFAGCGFDERAFLPCYGLAEATLIVSGGPSSTPPRLRSLDAEALSRHRVQPSNGSDARVVVGCGEPLDGTSLKIVDPLKWSELPEDFVGEIWLRGGAVSLGYFEQAAATKASFGARLRDTGEGPFLRTGDLGFISDGQLFVTGRLKDVIIIHGRNHYAEDLEASVDGCWRGLRPHRCAAFSIAGPERELAVVVAEVDPRRDGLDLGAGLESIRQAILSGHDLSLDAVVLVRAGSVATTSSGKIRRSACRERYEGAQLEVLAEWRSEDESGCPPGLESSAIEVDETRVSALLRASIAQRLGLGAEGVEPDTPFADLGLSSLQALEIAAELERELGCRVAVTAVFAHPTVSSLSAWLAHRVAEPSSAR